MIRFNNTFISFNFFFPLHDIICLFRLEIQWPDLFPSPSAVSIKGGAPNELQQFHRQPAEIKRCTCLSCSVIDGEVATGPCRRQVLLDAGVMTVMSGKPKLFAAPSDICPDIKVDPSALNRRRCGT